LREGVATTSEPSSWIDQARGAAPSTDTLHSDVDDRLKHAGIPVKVAREYTPANGREWDADERASGMNRVFRMVLHRSTTMPDDLIESVRLIPAVEQAIPGAIGMAPMPAPSSRRLGRTPGKDARKVVYLPEAHARARGDNAIAIAVLDTGVSMEHPEYQHQLGEGFDFVDIIDGAGRFVGDFVGADPDPTDQVGHGSHVAGVIAARGGKMPPGVVPECRILPVRVLGAMRQGNRRIGAGLVDNINAGIKWAVDKGADVINMSLGVRHMGRGGLPHERVIDYAKRKGVTIVAASGNDGTTEIYYPGGHPYVITVGAADTTGRVAQFSTYGDHVDLIAPGTDIYSTSLGDRYAFLSGTSSASPFVAGAAALLKSYAHEKGRSLSDGQVKHVLKHSADKIGTRFKSRKAGYGMLNLADALQLLEHKLN
jgi:subtilisin family serine protease